MRKPKYRKQPGRDFAFVEFRGARHRLPGAFNSAESRDAYKLFIERHVVGEKPLALRPTLADKTPSDPQQITIAAVVARFLIHAKAHYPGKKTTNEYANCRSAVAPLLTLFPSLPAIEFGPLKLKAVQQHLETTGNSRTYINTQVGRIKRCFIWAASEELVPAAVAQSLGTVKGLRAGRTMAPETESREPVAWEKVEAILPHLSPTVRAMVMLQWYTGARSDTICHATPSQFERPPGGELWFWRPKHKTEYLHVERRTELVLPVGPKCQEILLPFMDRDPDSFLFSPRMAGPSSRFGRKYTRFSYRQAVARACELAFGLPMHLRMIARKTYVARKLSEEDRKAAYAEVAAWRAEHCWSPHQLRHSRGTVVREQYGLEAAQAVLGHETLEATQIYAKRKFELAKKVASEIG